MTTKRLIAILKKLPPDAVIVQEEYETERFLPVEDDWTPERVSARAVHDDDEVSYIDCSYGDRCVARLKEDGYPVDRKKQPVVVIGRV
jgi:hypothetical protein